MTEPKKKRGRSPKKKVEELEIDNINVTTDYLQFVITQFNEALKENKKRIIVGSEYEDTTKIDFVIEPDQFIPFLNLLFDQTASSGHYMYLTILVDIIERVNKIDGSRLTIN